MKKLLFTGLFILSLIALIVSCTKLKESLLSSSRIEANKVNPNITDCLPGYHWDNFLKKCVKDNCPPGYHYDALVGGCVPDDVVKYYHGIQVTFTNGVLKFNSNANLDSVLSKLESDYETWNENYENQYPGLTADQLDSVDEITGFDEFKPVRDFENMFGDFYSKRSELEYEENNWLNNSDISNDNDPDSADYALDDFVDAISDINYQFKIGSDTYTFINDGLLKNDLSIEGGGGLMPQFATPCKAFKHTTGKVDFDNGSRRVFGRVAIHGGWPWGGVVKAVT